MENVEVCGKRRTNLFTNSVPSLPPSSSHSISLSPHSLPLIAQSLPSLHRLSLPSSLVYHSLSRSPSSPLRPLSLSPSLSTQCLKIFYFYYLGYCYENFLRKYINNTICLVLLFFLVSSIQ